MGVERETVVPKEERLRQFINYLDIRCPQNCERQDFTIKMRRVATQGNLILPTLFQITCNECGTQLARRDNDKQIREENQESL